MTLPTKQQVLWTAAIALIVLAVVYRVPMARRIVTGAAPAA